MGYMEGMKRAKIIMVPYPAKGHVTPILQLASALLSHGFEPIVITPEYIHKQIVKGIEDKNEMIMCMSIPDGMDDEKVHPDFFAIEAAMENRMPIHLERIVHELDEDGGVACMVVDLLASWAIEVANRCSVPAAGFWPAMLATYHLISAIPEMIRAGLISEEGIPQHEDKKFRIYPEGPILCTEDMPWLIGNLASRKGRFKFWTRTLNRSKTLKWLLVNSFPDEYPEDNYQTIKGSHHYPIVFPIGPLSKYAASKSPTFWEEDSSCLNWLDMQETGSVVYISFGSWVSPIGEEKIRNLALALEASRRPFIWVLNPAWRQGLPAGYLQRVCKQGKLVSWAPQVEVLQHKAVGCCLTHCGWNSTLEGIQCQKPLLCYPIAGDQSLNCNYIVDVWKIGIRLHGFGERDVVERLKRVMEDCEMSDRLWRLYERSMGKEASSRVRSHLIAFVGNLKKPTNEALK